MGVENENTFDASMYSYNNTIYVHLNAKLNNEVINIYNLEGKEIYRSELQNQFAEVKLNTPKGIYFVELISDDGRFTKKVYLD